MFVICTNEWIPTTRRYKIVHYNNLPWNSNFKNDCERHSRSSHHHASSIFGCWLAHAWPVCENYVSRIHNKLQFTWQDLLPIQTYALAAWLIHPSIHPFPRHFFVQFWRQMNGLTYSLFSREQVTSGWQVWMDWDLPTIVPMTTRLSASHHARFLHTPRRHYKRGRPIPCS
jgi:hypothetical protein